MRTATTLALCSVLAAAAAVPKGARADAPPIPLPVVRLAVGPSFHVGQDPLVGFAGDLTAGVLVLAGKNQTFMFDGELGWSFDRELNAFNLMFAIGVRKELMAYAAYQPRMLLGTREDRFAGGMRNAIAGHFLLDVFTVEVGHQFIASNGKLTQTANLMFGINPASFIFVLVGITTGGRR